MVDALASDRSDQSFREAVLPRRAWSARFVADAHGSQSIPDGNAIDLIPIADQVARGLIPRERLCDLARDPAGGRMRCDVDPDEISAGQSHDDEGIEQVEAKGRGNDYRSMAAMSGEWLRRKVRHPWEGGQDRLTMYFATLD
jgi:hypothetical protein